MTERLQVIKVKKKRRKCLRKQKCQKKLKSWTIKRNPSLKLGRKLSFLALKLSNLTVS